MCVRDHFYGSKSSATQSYKYKCMLFFFFFSFVRNPPNSDVDYGIFNVRTSVITHDSYACVSIHTAPTNQHNILTRGKNSHQFVMWRPPNGSIRSVTIAIVKTEGSLTHSGFFSPRGRVKRGQCLEETEVGFS